MSAAPPEAPALAVTMGEPAGIGGEIALAAWSARHETPVPPFFLIDDPERLRRLAEHLDWSVPVRAIAEPEDALAVFERAVPVLPLPLPGRPDPGTPDPANAPAVVASLDRAIELVRAGRASGMVTNPIRRSSLSGAGFTFPGHAEYLALLTGAAAPPVTMLASRSLRVVPVTVHLSLARALEVLNAERICHTARVTAHALARDFGVASPRLSIAAVNPQAGEGGALGREEIETIGPAIAQLRGERMAVDGPHPADTLFHERARSGFDAAICMYHDQARIPLKTLDFERGVRVTLGMSVIRTAPDHGTALAIAGKGIAHKAAFQEALRIADRMVRHRTGGRIDRA
ncbi:MAG: 4-hydroxythreonine-4-phosphate dehydrogenase PdxA [Azospirillaceae bacterium]